MTKVVFLLIPGLHLLDLAGPAQASGTAAELGGGYELSYVAEQEDVPSAQGVTVRAAVTWPSLTPVDVIVIPGRRCTTHHDLQDDLASRYPAATAVPDVLYVVDRGIATSAGIASGTDLALHLIAVRDGSPVASRVAREMAVYARRNGDKQQASAMLRHRNHLSDVAHRAQDHIESRFSAPLCPWPGSPRRAESANAPSPATSSPRRA